MKISTIFGSIIILDFGTLRTLGGLDLGFDFFASYY
jgi:hypothetical protein